DNISCLGGYCANGLCIAEGVPEITNESCSVTSDCKGDSECINCNSSGTCVGSYGNSCTDDDTGAAGVCSLGYCRIGECNTNADCGTGYFCADQISSCYTETKPGKCQKLDFLSRSITVNGSTETWYVSNRWMSWWDAQSACDKMGKTMVTVGELVSGWSGSSTGTFTRTERAQKLNDAIGGHYVWTSNDSSSCYVFYVGLSDGYVGNCVRHSVGLALCH
ncbi:MAG: hypothetical protein ACI4QM_03720, partial [Alphaproteobacteria bacterium]